MEAKTTNRVQRSARSGWRTRGRVRLSASLRNLLEEAEGMLRVDAADVGTPVDGQI
jgi:hypothetical protein